MSKIGNDQLDSRRSEDIPYLITTTSSTKVSRVIPTHYKTNHKGMGIALIFNHTKVKGFVKRSGTEKDKERLEKILTAYGFDVRIKNDLKRDELCDVVEEVAKEDHSNYDCFLLIVMSHGKRNHLYASDGRSYNFEELWAPFSGAKCPTLAGKPKLIFAQACRGNNAECGVRCEIDGGNTSLLSDENDSPKTYTIPTTADILLYFPTMLGFVSFRRTDGSWFIQTICKVLEQYIESCNGIDMYQMLTAVNREVAFEYESNSDEEKYNMKREMPNFISTLTKSFILKPKRKAEEYNSISVKMSNKVFCNNNKCKQVINFEKNDNVQCEGDCKKWYHQTCSGLGNKDFIHLEENIIWFCLHCNEKRQKRKSLNVNQSHTFTVANEANTSQASDSETNIMQKLDSILVKLASYENNFSQLQNDFSQLQKEFRKMRETMDS